MSFNTWMPFYWADYFAHTSHLNAAEHGAYLMLIGHLWTTKKAIPNDDTILARIARCTIQEWQGIRIQIEPMFDLSEKGWNHNRVKNELKRAQNLHEKRVEAGKKRQSKNKDLPAHAEHTTQPGYTQPQPQPQPQPHIEDIYIGENEKSGGKQREAEFEQFWSAYPRKVAKGAARIAFKGCCPKKVSLDALISAAKRYAEKRNGQDVNFTKHPDTWLNSEGWLDEDLQSKPIEAPADPERNLWLARISGFRKRKFWNPMTWGPSPDEPGFRGPKDLTS